MSTPELQLPPIRSRLTLALHALLFTGAVVVIAVAAMGKARHYEGGPDRDTRERLFDGRMAQGFEKHYDAQFPARNFGISVWAAIDYLLFDEAQTGLVIGKDDWLFTDEEFVIAEGASATVDANLALVEAVRDRLAAQDVRLVVAVVPAKARIYAEQLQNRQPPALHGALYERALEEFKAAELAAPDLRGVLADGKARAPTYLRTDTHWTPHGAALAAVELAKAVRTQLPAPQAPRSYQTIRDARQAHRGDLLSFLPLDPYFSALLPPADELVPAHTEAVGGSEQALLDTAGDGLLGGDGGAPRIALVGTSYSANAKWNFAGALQQALDEDVANYARDGKGPFVPMLDYLDSADFKNAPPQLVIWELPERYLPVAQKRDDGQPLATKLKPAAHR